MTTENGVATVDPGAIMEAVIAKGDLSKLDPGERAMYYRRTCESMGLNPLTQPFQYITLNQKLTLYATRTATDQLRKINNVSLEVVSEETTADGLRVVRVRATDGNGRIDEEIGAVNVSGLKADALANAFMKAITKAKRRATLSICGLGWLDESEIETIPAARRAPVAGHFLPDDSEPEDEYEPVVNQATGEIVEHDNMGEEIIGEFIAAIQGSADEQGLLAVAAELRDAGVSTPELREAYKTRMLAIVKDDKNAQPELIAAGAAERHTAL